MIQLRGSFGGDFQEIQREMERFLEHLSHGKKPVSLPIACGWHPPVDMYETPHEVMVLVEAAGIRQEDVELLVDGRTLLIRGERPNRARGSLQVYHLLEIGCGLFERSIELPVPVDPERAEAHYENGFLEISLPKVDVAVSRRVNIKPLAAK